MNEGNIALAERAGTLSACLAESKSAYSVLLDLEKQQQTLIEAESIEGVADKIAEKQAMLSQIQTADKRLHHGLASWQEVKDQAPDALRERLQSQVDLLQSVMSELLDVQRHNEESLKKHGEEISQKLREIQKNKTAHRGYQHRAAEDAYGKSKFYDKTS